jgi:hypothetical protein
MGKNYGNCWGFMKVLDEDMTGENTRMAFLCTMDRGNPSYSHFLRNVINKAVKDKKMDGYEAWPILGLGAAKMGNVVKAIMGYYTIWQEMDNFDPAMLEIMKNTVTYLENAIMASEASVDMEGEAAETDMDMESPIDMDKISQVIKTQLAEVLKDKDSLRMELVDLIIDARQNVKIVVREECRAIMTEMARIVKNEGDSFDRHTAHVKRALKRIHDIVLADHMSVDGTEKSKSSGEEENAKRRKDSTRELSDNPDQAEGMLLGQAFKNNMTELMEHKIMDWLLSNTKHMQNATRDFDHDLMDFKDIKLGKKVTELSTKIWDCMIGSPTTRRKNKEKNEQEPILNTHTEGRYQWLPWYTVKKFLEKEDVWGSCSDKDFWQAIIETKNHEKNHHSFMVKQLNDIDDFAIMIKVTPEYGDYSLISHKDMKTQAAQDGEAKRWQRQKTGKGGSWTAPQEDNGGKDSQSAQSSGWASWGTPGDASTMPESHGGQKGKGKQQQAPRDLLASMAPWQQGKGTQQQTMMAQEETDAPWRTGKGNQNLQIHNQQNMMMNQKGGKGAYQQGPAGPQGTSSTTSAWHQGQGGMLVPKSTAGQQQGMTAPTWQGYHEVVEGQSSMGMTGPVWGQQTTEVAQPNGSMGKPPGAPPGNKVPFDMNQGPPTWMIGQWHPSDWDMNQQVISWYLIGKDEVCEWPSANGSQRIAEHFHGDCLMNKQYFDQFMNAGQVGNIVENPCPAWNMNTKGKGKNQKGYP